MKVYSDKKNRSRKSWSIILREEMPPSVDAVDSDTGELIAHLIIFDISGAILLPHNNPDIMLSMGYNPYEHHNKFDDVGRIIIG